MIIPFIASDLREVSPQVLAYIGDSVYELYARCHVASRTAGNNNKMHKMNVKYVSAVSQAKAMRIIEAELDLVLLLLYAQASTHTTPLVPFFIVFYILAYGQWILCYLLIARERKEYCYRFFVGDLIAKTICLVVFLVFPTTLNRPEITGGGIFEQLVAFIYSLDAPDNLFPSIHCLESWMCYRGCRKLANAPGWLPEWFSGANLVFTLLVFASTVLLKQHVLIDIAGGVATVEIGLFLSGKILKKAGIT